MGHFSTVGDIEVLRMVERQLANASMHWDIAPYAKSIARSNPDWLDIHSVNPADYTHLLVVCGPFWRPYCIRCGIDLDAFAHCTRIGVNLTMIEDVDVYNPFDRLVGRDNNLCVRPDISFLYEAPKVPVAGLCLVRHQKEYGDNQQLDKAGNILRRLAERHRLAVVQLDTEWPVQRNANGFAIPEQFESVCARVDVMLTTRLHGTVLSLKNGVPVIVIDGITGGGKVLRQANAIGWPEAYAIDQLSVSDAILDDALVRCLSPEGRARALACAANAREALLEFSSDFVAALHAAPEGKPSFTSLAERPSRFQRKLKKMTGKIARYFRGRRKKSVAFVK
jgi:hypothetical protein